MTEKKRLSVTFPMTTSTMRNSFFLFAVILLGPISLASADASATLLPNWNRYARNGAGTAPAQTFAYLVSENIIRDTLNSQVVPVLSFSCSSNRLKASIFFNQFGIKRIRRIVFEADSSPLALNRWVISRDNRSIDYTSNVSTMMHSLYAHHELHMRLVGQSGQVIGTTFNISRTRLGTRSVRKACRHAGS